MEITVVVQKVLQPQQFQKRDGSIGVRNSFVGKTNTGQYDREMKFDVLNAETWQQMMIQVGQTYVVSFDASSHSYNSPTKGEIWFTSLTAWKAVLQTMAYQPQQPQQPQYVQQPMQQQYQQPAQPIATPMPQAAPTPTSNDDIPF